MDVVLIVSAVIVLSFGFVVFSGAPYLPTLNKQIDEAFDMLELKPGDTLLELGSGDGRFLAAAAKRGIHSVGYELNPLLVAWTKLLYWRYRSFISVRWQSFWSVQLPDSDGMYVFLLDRYMKRLDTKIIQYVSKSKSLKNYKVVSFTFKIPDKKPRKSKNGLHLYVY